MKKFLAAAAAVLVTGLCAFTVIPHKPETTMQSTPQKSLYDLEISSLDGKSKIRFADYKGKNLLLVNVASECGYTPQYEGLQQIADQYKDQLVIIGFPCNQFGGQEPGTSEEIAGFCKKNYGVTFPLTEKIDVKGEHQHPVYQWLTHKDQNGLGDFEVKWNFNKFLVDKEGHLAAYFPSSVKPTDTELLSKIK